MLEDCGPARGDPLQQVPAAGRKATVQVPADRVKRPGSGPLIARAGPLSRALPCSRAPTKQLTDTGRSVEVSHKTDTKKSLFLNETERKGGGARWSAVLLILPKGRGETKPWLGSPPSPHQP